MSDSQKRTLASSLYVELRRMILDGTFPPETKMNIRDLCERFSVTLSPVREALNRLSTEGFLVQSDHRGFAVAPVTIPELMELTLARCLITEVSLRQSIALGDGKWEESVVLSFHRLLRTPRHTESRSRDSNPAWEMAHAEFHRSLIAACGSRWLIEACDRLFDASERYRSLAKLAGISRGNVDEEHRDIMQAAIDRDSDRAVKLLNSHYNTTAELVRRAVESRELSAAGDRTRP